MARLRGRVRVAKWAGVVLSLLTIVVWSVSLKWSVGYARMTGRTPILTKYTPVARYQSIVFAFGRGSCVVGYFSVPSQDLGLNTRSDPGRVEIFGQLEFTTTSPTSWAIVLPLWIVFLLVVIPTAYLFWRHRPIPPHCCQSCGYDLTGNTSGVCPECGDKA